MGEEFLEQSMPKGSESSSVSSLAPNKDDEFRDAEMQHALAQLKEYTETLKEKSAELEEGFAALKGEVAELKQNMATFQDTASPAHKRSLPGEGPAPKKCKMQTSKANMGVLHAKRTSHHGKKPGKCDSDRGAKIEDHLYMEFNLDRRATELLGGMHKASLWMDRLPGDTDTGKRGEVKRSPTTISERHPILRVSRDGTSQGDMAAAVLNSIVMLVFCKKTRWEDERFILDVIPYKVETLKHCQGKPNLAEYFVDAFALAWLDDQSAEFRSLNEIELLKEAARGELPPNPPDFAIEIPKGPGIPTNVSHMNSLEEMVGFIMEHIGSGDSTKKELAEWTMRLLGYAVAVVGRMWFKCDYENSPDAEAAMEDEWDKH